MKINFLFQQSIFILFLQYSVIAQNCNEAVRYDFNDLSDWEDASQSDYNFNQISIVPDPTSNNGNNVLRLETDPTVVVTGQRLKMKTKLNCFGAGRYIWRVFIPVDAEREGEAAPFQIGDRASIGPFLFSGDPTNVNNFYELDFEVGSGTAGTAVDFGLQPPNDRLEFCAADNELLVFMTKHDNHPTESDTDTPPNTTKQLIKKGHWYLFEINLSLVKYQEKNRYFAKWIIDNKIIKTSLLSYGDEITFPIFCSVENLSFIGDHLPNQKSYAYYDYVEFIPHSITEIIDFDIEANKPALIHHWRLNEPGGELAHDSASFLPHTGRHEGNSIFNQTAPTENNLGRGVELTGGQIWVDSINFAAARLNTLTTNFTVSAWVNPNTVSNTNKINPVFGRDRRPFETFSRGWGFGLKGSEVFFYINNLNSTLPTETVSSGANILAGQWSHIAVTFSSERKAEFFVNGISIGKTETLAEINSSGFELFHGNWFIGWEVSDGTSFSTISGEHYLGKLADIRLYNYTLSSDEIKSILIDSDSDGLNDSWETPALGSCINRVLPSHDLDNDTTINLLEYAFGMNPKMNDSNQLPILGKTELQSKQYLSISYHKPNNVTNLKYELEVTTDLIKWENINKTIFVGSEEVMTGLTRLTFRSNDSIDDFPKQYMRVSINHINL